MDDLIVADALKLYYKKANFGDDGGVNNPSVKIELLKGIYVYIPNVDARKKVVLKHDIHHLVTGYNTNMKGEIEISAWEISTGCQNNWAAFTINTLGAMMGVVFNLPGIWRAWVRGKRTSNLYYQPYSDKELMQMKVGDLKIKLGIKNELDQPINHITSSLGFLAFLIFGTILSILSIALIPLILLYSGFIIFSNSWRKP